MKYKVTVHVYIHAMHLVINGVEMPDWVLVILLVAALMLIFVAICLIEKIRCCCSCIKCMVCCCCPRDEPEYRYNRKTNRYVKV